jgi:hypothetical protein
MAQSLAVAATQRNQKNEFISGRSHMAIYLLSLGFGFAFGLFRSSAARSGIRSGNENAATLVTPRSDRRVQDSKLKSRAAQ